jgi:hypothetical protein
MPFLNRRAKLKLTQWEGSELERSAQRRSEADKDALWTVIGAQSNYRQGNIAQTPPAS